MDFGFINEGWFGILAGLVLNIAVAEIWRRFGPHYPALSYVVSEVGTYHSPAPARKLGVMSRRLQLRFDDEVVHRLEMFDVSIWNGQLLSIDRSAITRRDPLRLRLVDGGAILGAEILVNTDEVGGFELDIGAEEIGIKFDFIAPGQGIKLLVFTSSHGPDPEAPFRWDDFRLNTPMLEMAGTLQNIRIIQLPSPRSEFPLRFYRKPIFGAIFISLGLAGALGIASLFVDYPLDKFLGNLALTTFLFWEVLAWIPLWLFAGYFWSGFHVPQKLR